MKVSIMEYTIVSYTAYNLEYAIFKSSSHILYSDMDKYQWFNPLQYLYLSVKQVGLYTIGQQFPSCHVFDHHYSTVYATTTQRHIKLF